MKIYPKGSKVWAEPVNVNIASTDDVIKKYEEGFSGIFLDTSERDKFTQIAIETGGFSQVEEAAHAYNWSDSFAGQLVIPFVHIIEAYPASIPGPGQLSGNCVSKSNANTILGSLVCEVVSGQIDEVSGKLETFPKVSDIAIKNNVLASEPNYWGRNHGGDGDSCDRSASYSITTTGAVLRQNYPDVNINLEKYVKNNSYLYGRAKPPQRIIDAFKNNRIRTAARVNEFAAIRDSLGQGRFVHTCGSEGFARPRNEHGVSVRRGTWQHAFPYFGADDRPEIVRMYKGPLILCQNSWGNYNSGNRDIFDSAKFVLPHKKDLWISIDLVNPRTGNIMIPNGSFWCRASDVRNRRCFVFAGIAGWEAQKIPTWGVDLWG